MATDKGYMNEIEALLEGDADVNFPHEVLIEVQRGAPIISKINYIVKISINFV